MVGRRASFLFVIALFSPIANLGVARSGEPSSPGKPAPDTVPILITESEDEVRIETDSITAAVRKKGYVSGIAAGSFVDTKTGAHECGIGAHIMDVLMAPGWRDDGYERNPKLHGNLPKHYVEGPQICTKARELSVEVIRGDGFVATQMSYTFREPGRGYRAGSTWDQTIVFLPGERYVLCAERITSANNVDDLFYRIDMPGHVRHGGERGATFEQIYLSYHDGLIPATEFATDFGPDERFFYQRQEGRIPQRMIRAYQIRHEERPGPWFAGMTLDPAAVSEGWCHQRGYVSFIQEIHRRPVQQGASFGAAYVVGWFDDVQEMHEVYDRHRGATGIRIDDGGFALVKQGDSERER